MDLQKVSQAFEAWFIENGILIDTDFNVAKRAFEAGAAWQAAKAQAIPDGFVVVPEEPTERMLDSAYSSISDNLHYADLENIYKAMIWSAQEPTNESE